MIALRDARVERGGRVVLADASLHVGAGEVVAVLGPNGGGKSTLVGALSGELALAAGSATLDGRAIASWAPEALARRRAVLRQSSTLDAAFRVEEVVRFGRAPWRDNAVESDRRVEAAMIEADVTALAGRFYTELSGGERRRVQLARVLAQMADDGALLLDEPVAHLDPRHQLGALDAAVRRARSGATVLVVLHEPNLALQFADRVLVLDRGRIVAAGDPARTLTPALMATVFGVRVVACPGPRPDRPVLVPEPAHTTVPVPLFRTEPELEPAAHAV